MQGTHDFPFVWRPANLARFSAFCLTLRLFEGEWAGIPLKLMQWQAFVVGSLLSWVHKDTGLRRFDTGYVEVPRKNAKSALASALSLYMLMFDNEAAAQVYMLATKKDQAKIVYNAALKFVPFKMRAKYLRTRFTETTFDKTDSRMQPLASDSKTLDGLNPHFACADELHEWPSASLWEVVYNGMGSRTQPLIFGITTAGSDMHGIARQLRDTSESLALDAGKRGFVLDTFFGYVACPSVEDEKHWDDPRVWAIANPSLGIAKSAEYMRKACDTAKAQPSRLNQFLNKQLNIWTGAAQQWIPSRLWEAGAVPRADLLKACAGRKCFGGMDLARVSDLSALSLVFPPESEGAGLLGKWLCLQWHWCPEAKAHDRTKNDRVPYQHWADKGLLTLTEGEATDYAVLYRDILAITKRFRVESIAYDRMFAVETVQKLQAEGIEMLAHGQGFLSMSAPTEELERMLVSGCLAHDGNPLMGWEMGNVVLSYDAAGCIKPDKKKSRDRIDGPVSLIMARGASMQEPEHKEFTGLVAFAL